MEDGQQKTQTGHWNPVCLHTPFSPLHTMSAPCHNCHDVGIVIVGILFFTTTSWTNKLWADALDQSILQNEISSFLSYFDLGRF